MNTQMTPKGIVADATEAMVAAFDPKDLAPASLIGVADGMNKIALLFSDKVEAAKYLAVMQQDDSVDVEISHHGYIVYLDASKSLDDDLTPKQRYAAQSMMAEASANALAIVNNVSRMGWASFKCKQPLDVRG
jgi:tryptophanase